jgi:hypothetical protein
MTLLSHCSSFGANFTKLVFFFGTDTPEKYANVLLSQDSISFPGVSE